MSIIKYVKELVDLSPRFAHGEEKAAQYIRTVLDTHKVTYTDQEYEVAVPVPEKVTLIADGKKIECRNVGMEGGTFEGKDNLVSSLFWGDTDFYYPQNINFNPRCDGAVSMALYYKHPALAIRRSDIETILNAEKIHGETIVKPYTFTGHNFLVGNRKNPKTIIFTHYDCWETGAIDNASGTAVLMDTVLHNPELFKNNLFVIAGTEEISYDEPIYWGKGYREFQKEYSVLLEKADSLKVIDGVGYSEHQWITDPHIVILGLPLDTFETYQSKCSMITGDFDFLMEIYHSSDDTPDLLSENRLRDAQKLLIDSLS
jgi:hypothetical protein